MSKYGTEIIVFAALFGSSAVLSHRSTSLFVPAAALGAFFAVAALPLLDPKKWKESVLRDMLAGSLAAIIIAYWSAVPPEGYVLAIMLGLILGLVSPWIVKHVQLP